MKHNTVLLEDKVVGESRWRICCWWWDGENRALVEVLGFKSGTTVEVWGEQKEGNKPRWRNMK
jgi:hypothetical protein